jgi:hypothetical protein
MTVPCGACGRGVEFGMSTLAMRCLCGAIITKTMMRAEPDYAGQMADWAAAHGVTPLDPQRVAQDAREQFSVPVRTSRDEFYASWSAYDAALSGMSQAQRILQQRAEVLELERWHRR